MSLFAHVETGAALDPQENASAEDYLRRYTPDVTAQWTVKKVPDGTQHGAKDNGDGTYANPQPAPTIKVPMTLSATAFQDICETGFGSGAQGATRFGKVLRDMSTSADDLVFSAYQRFIKSLTFDKAKASPLFSLLASKALITAQERAAILLAWPEN